MNLTTAIQRLNQLDQQGRYIFTHRDIEKVFPEDSKRTLNAGLNRLIKQNMLERVGRGAYIYSLSHHKKDPYTLELIAKTLRRGEYNYVSLESALSEYGAISQIPIDRLTIVTTGRKGEYKTPFGTIEFTHTKRTVSDIINQIHNIGRPLRFASKHAALRDLKRVGRNMHLVDEAIIHES